jgi:hypothetical protein
MMKKEKAPILGEDRGKSALFRRFVDYARARRRPSVSPEGKAVVIDMHMSIRVERRTVIGVNWVWKQKSLASRQAFRVLAII